MSHPLTLPFIEPIERASLPQYFKVIKRPMSFLTVKKKLERRLYASKDSFIDDIRLVFRNCQKFNDVGSKLYKDSVEIGKFVDSLLQPTARGRRASANEDEQFCALVLHHVRMHEDAGPFSDPRPGLYQGVSQGSAEACLPAGSWPPPSPRTLPATRLSS